MVKFLRNNIFRFSRGIGCKKFFPSILSRSFLPAGKSLPLQESVFFAVKMSTLFRVSVRRMSNAAISSKGKNDLILLDRTESGVTTLTLNDPKRLNGWTAGMLQSLKDNFARCAKDEHTKALILTGTSHGDNPYYCAGVNLSSVMGLMHPKKLRQMIIEHNAATFDNFISFPKPLVEPRPHSHLFPFAL